MIVYECNTAKIEYCEDHQYLYTKWSNFTSSSEFHEIIDFRIDFMLKNNIYRLLSDVTEHRVIGPSDQEFDKDITVFAYYILGNYKNALIIKPRSAASGSAFRYRRMVNDAVNKEIIQLFETEDKAMEWLLSE